MAQATFLCVGDAIARRLTATADADSALDATKFASQGPVPAGGPAKVSRRVQSRPEGRRRSAEGSGHHDRSFQRPLPEDDCVTGEA